MRCIAGLLRPSPTCRGPRQPQTHARRDRSARLSVEKRHDLRTTRALSPGSLRSTMSAPPPPPADGPKSPHGSDESAPRRSGFDKSSLRLRPRGWDLEIAWIANRQHGLISLEQLEGMGMDRRTVAARGRSGRLHRIHRGVYSVGHVSSTPEAAFLAAVLACGPEAVLSHGSAATLWGFWKLDDAAIHVMAPNRRGRSPAGIVPHRDGCLLSSDRTEFHRVPAPPLLGRCWISRRSCPRGS